MAASTGVAILVWPEDSEARDRLRESGRARLLLVPRPVPAPILEDHLEDWVRLPVTDEELALRFRRLARLAQEADDATHGCGAARV